MRSLLLILLLFGPAHADPAADYQKGRNAYLYGDFKKTIQLLDPLVGADPVELVDAEKANLALEMLGLSRYYLGEEEAAKVVFERLILREPDRALSPITAPPEAVALYDALKGELQAEIDRRREAIEKARAEQAERDRLYVREEFRYNSRVLAVLPLGIGQFQNDDDLWGGLFLGGELIAIALSVSFLLAAEDLRNANGLYDRADIANARNLQTAQLVSGGVAAALMIGGAIHALVNFQEREKIGEQRIDPKAAPAPAGVKISPAGAGVLIEF